MDKVGDFFDEITPIFEAKNFRDRSAILLLGADENNECACINGTIGNLHAMLASAMETRKELAYVVIKAAEYYTKKYSEGFCREEEDVEEDGLCDS